jgi:transcriptional regulator with XRE-family HTH domain
MATQPIRDSPPTFAQELRRLREDNIPKQCALAIDIGRSAAAVSIWENGRKLPSLPALDRIAVALRNAGVPEVQINFLRSLWVEARSNPLPPLALNRRIA